MALQKRIASSAFLALMVLFAAACGGPAEEPAPKQEIVEFPALQILRGMTDHLREMQTFSVHTQLTMEEELESGHIADFDVSTRILLQRPNRVHAKRSGGLVDQAFFYDGTSVTVFNATEGVYATTKAPATVEETIDYVRETLDLVVPASDLLYREAFTLLTLELTHAVVIGKTVINGVTCDHLLFSRPGVDFQVWVADSGSPLPIKYVVTDTATPERLSVTTVMTDWNENPTAKDADFKFATPDGAREVPFLTRAGAGNSGFVGE